jgi:hypothetical protein
MQTYSLTHSLLNFHLLGVVTDFIQKALDANQAREYGVITCNFETNTITEI